MRTTVGLANPIAVRVPSAVPWRGICNNLSNQHTAHITEAESNQTDTLRAPGITEKHARYGGCAAVFPTHQAELSPPTMNSRPGSIRMSEVAFLRFGYLLRTVSHVLTKIVVCSPSLADSSTLNRVGA
ncbi:hypothetical protein [Allorhodopirellula heiligendammensis]|uniref:Uncharacterized protein n=1 Tax=Allorhodopirellula heiligendammensis TaxID=2714739 RepID=A0A5C6C2P9_9BACT|nr:hypothetical protein [Allorhodopirellula heiligendammensis]TWU17931.1 hypothetical protein Poly21_00830 [Allorhodopirellula heiligendammensis]